MSIVIIDCDNVLSDDGWRIPFIDWDQEDVEQRYHTYHLLSVGDKPANLQLFDVAPHAVMFTAMAERYRWLRSMWLQKHHLPVSLVLMREDGDFRSSVETKRSMLHKLRGRLCKEHDKIVAAYDDRADIVQMYNEEGIDGRLIQIHNKCAWTKPSKVH